MGIRGLYTYVEKEKAYEIVDLIKMADENGGIEILVDFNNHIRQLFELVYRRMASENNNDFLLFWNGEFDIFYQASFEYQKMFESCGIKLVWLLDGPRGLDDEPSTQKRETWVKREKHHVDKANEILSGCKLKLPLDNLQNFIPPGSFEVSLEGLKDAGAEIIQLLQSESDEYVGLEFQRRNSYAILTNDTDFLMFPNCRVIFSRMTNLCYNNYNVKLPFGDKGNPAKMFEKPNSLRCPVVTQSHILNLFQLRSPDQILVMSILKGNDNICSFSNELQYNLKITLDPSRNAHVTRIAKYIKNNSLTIANILDHPPIKDFSRSCPELIPAIEHLQQLYSLERIKNIKESLLIYKEGTIEDPLTDFFAEKLSKLEFGKDIYSLHHGVVKDPCYFEQPSMTCPPVSTILSELEAFIYPYVLNRRLDHVNKCGYRGEYKINIVPVTHSDFKSNEILPFPNDNGINLFEKAWSHLEPDESLNYVNKFGLQCGFLCYLLRYFHQITNNRNLCVSTDEFKALFITVFYHYAQSTNEDLETQIQRNTFLGMNIYPSERCMIINMWFLRIFEQGKYFSGGAFNLTDNFPSVKNVINGTILYAFYEHIMNHQNRRIEHLGDVLQNSIGSLADQIFKRYEEQYAAVTNG